MSNEQDKSNEQWELVVGGTMKNGVLEGGEVKGTFASRDEAEAEGANLRRSAGQSIRARRVGDSPERLAQRRAAAARGPVETLVQPVATVVTAAKSDPRK